MAAPPRKNRWARPRRPSTPGSGTGGRWWAVLWGLLILVTATGCRVDVRIGVDVEPSGEGSVTVAVSVDDEVVEELGGDLASAVATGDLTATGWVVEGPTRTADGLHTMTATKRFGNPAEATEVLAEVAGPRGPFRDFAVEREVTFTHVRWRFRGTVDFSGGVEAFSDDGLRAALGEPLGEPVEAIEARIGRALDEVFTVQVAVRLPGEVVANAPTVLDNGAVWEPRLSERRTIRLEATGTTLRWRRLLALGVAAAAGAGAVVIAVGAIVRRPGRRGG